MTPAVREESQLAAPPGRTQEARGPTGRLARWGLLTDLDKPGDLVANISPNWCASVMGTGIVAVTAASLPGQVAGLRAAALAIWALAAALLIALTAATIMHWLRHRQTARSHARDPVMAHFDGALPMAVLTREHCTASLVNEERGCHDHPDPGPVIWAPR